jgi:hypothetical protein
MSINSIPVFKDINWQVFQLANIGSANKHFNKVILVVPSQKLETGTGTSVNKLLN